MAPSLIRMQVDGGVCEIVIDSPPVNAMSSLLLRKLRDVFRHIDGRTDVDVVVLSSAVDRAFSAGADVREMEAAVASTSGELDERRQVLARECFDAVRQVAQPTIAVLNGPALGAGAVIAGCCDVRYGSTRARIGLPEVNVARCGGGRHMMRLLPQGLVRELYFTGEPLDAARAERYGLINALFEPGEELEAARALARKIAMKSPAALRLGKQALNASEPLSLDEGYALEQDFTLRLARTADAKEAARAFLEKREPAWLRS